MSDTMIRTTIWRNYYILKKKLNELFYNPDTDLESRPLEVCLESLETLRCSAFGILMYVILGWK